MQHQADATTMPGAQFVDPKILARIGSLELLARTVVATLERWRRQEGHASSLTVDSLRENGWA